MNKDIFEGKWKEMRGQMKEWWGELTDDELEQAAGNSEQIVGLLQQKYGYTREKAEKEFNTRLEDVKDLVKKSKLENAAPWRGGLKAWHSSGC